MVNSDPDFFPQGLKKTCVIMDQERPRSDLSINSRNDLRKVLHLEFLYKENKVSALRCGVKFWNRVWQSQSTHGACQAIRDRWQEVWRIRPGRVLTDRSTRQGFPSPLHRARNSGPKEDGDRKLSWFYCQVRVVKPQTPRALPGARLPGQSCVTWGGPLPSHSLPSSSESQGWGQSSQQCHLTGQLWR